VHDRFDRVPRTSSYWFNCSTELRAAGVPLRPSDRDLLEVYTHLVRWQGRYPAPKERKEWEAGIAATRRALFDDAAVGKLKMLKPNGRLNWLSYSELWRTASEVYAALCR